MSKKMLINVDVDESRVAIVEDGRLANLELETLSKEQFKGNLYKGVVHKVEQSFQAAFVDFGSDKQGFLPLSEVHPSLYPEGSDKKTSIQNIIKPGQELLVQVVRDEIGNKGATLSTHLSLPGRYLVLISESDKTGISRKISDEDRRRLKEVMADMEVPKGFGTIIRTAGTECEAEEIQKDLGYLTRLWGVIEKTYKEKKTPGLVFEERSLPIRAVRDYFTDEFEEVLIDDPMSYQEVQDFVGLVMPQYKDSVRHYAGRVPLFIQHKIEDQIEEVFSRKVPLPSGGSIVIDSTEALVAIDVNSGRVKGEDIEETAFKTNVEAAREVARQVIIRDLGGLIIVDFIDMRDRKKVREVEQALRESFKFDKARRKFARISEFGLLEMSRQRLKSTLMKSSFDRCHHCDGLGLVRSPDSAGMYLLRRVREITASGRIHQVVVRAPIAVANFLVNRKRRELYALEVERRTLVEVHADSELPSNQASIEFVDKKTRGKPKLTVQKVDLVRAEEVRREGEPLRRGDVIFRDIPETVDFSKMYDEVSDSAEQASEAREERERRNEARREARKKKREESSRSRKREPEESKGWWQKVAAFFQGDGSEEVVVEETSRGKGGSRRNRSGGGGGNKRGGRRTGEGRGRNERNASEDGGEDRRRRRRRRGRRGAGGSTEEGNARKKTNGENTDSGEGNTEPRRRRRRSRGRGGNSGSGEAGVAAKEASGTSSAGSDEAKAPKEVKSPRPRAAAKPKAAVSSSSAAKPAASAKPAAAKSDAAKSDAAKTPGPKAPASKTAVAKPAATKAPVAKPVAKRPAAKPAGSGSAAKAPLPGAGSNFVIDLRGEKASTPKPKAAPKPAEPKSE